MMLPALRLPRVFPLADRRTVVWQTFLMCALRVFRVLATLLVWRFLRTGGTEMPSMMNKPAQGPAR